jgi:hypothetical protein
MFLRKILTYSLLVLILVTFNYKAISYYLDSSGSSIACVQEDFDCEEKSESKKSSEKDEKKNFSEELLSADINSLIVVIQQSFMEQSRLLYNTSDYSMAIYSPPEQAGI